MLRKEINRLLSKEIANIYYKLLLTRKTDVSKLRFSIYILFFITIFSDKEKCVYIYCKYCKLYISAANKQFLKEWFGQKFENIIFT